MEGKKYFAYNKTQESFLSLRITSVDDVRSTGLVQSLSGDSQASMWLHSSGEIPADFGPPAFDLVFLDEDCRVVDLAESHLGAACESPKVQAASALALPPKTITATKTRCGDELVIWSSTAEIEPAERKSKHYTSIRLNPILAPLFPRKSTEKSPVSLVSKPEDSMPRPKKRVKVEPPSDDKESPITRFRSWIADSLPQASSDTPVSILSPSTAPAPVATSSASTASASTSPAPSPQSSAGWRDSRPISLEWEVPGAIARMPAERAPVPTPSAPVQSLHVVSPPAASYPGAGSRDHFAPKSRPERTPPSQQPQPTFAERRQEPVQVSNDSAVAESDSQEAPSLIARFLRWLNAPPTASKRHSMPGLVAYFWHGGNPKPHPVINISTSGLYLKTEERWMPDTVLVMSLQRISGDMDDPENRISVLSRVARFGEDGVGLQFVTSDSIGLRYGQVLPGMGTDKVALKEFLDRFNRLERGA